MNILMLASEIVPFAKEGGIADVIGSLPKALEARDDVTIQLMMPLYGGVDRERHNIKPIGVQFETTLTSDPISVELYKGVLPTKSEADPQVEVFFIGSDAYFGGEAVYGDHNGHDDKKRFTAFSLAALEAAKHLDSKPDLIHCHDWHTGIIPLKLESLSREDDWYSGISTVFTIHNLGYEGSTEPEILDFANIDPASSAAIPKDLLDGDIDLLYEGIANANKVTTVSETYAKEILTPEYGQGMLEVLQSRKDDLVGILNGIDYDVWNPATDEAIVAQYSSDNPLPKEQNKADLQKKQKFAEDPDAPLIGVVSRLVTQKGMDLIVEYAEKLKNLGVQIVILGTGESAIEDQIQQAATNYPENIAANITFDINLARQIYAGADMFLIPSVYEPSGLTQMISMKYGTVPIVRSTGGLRDTVVDYDASSTESTGFVFANSSADELYDAIARAVEIFTSDPRGWQELQARCMAQDFSWDVSAQKYIELYHDVINSSN